MLLFATTGCWTKTLRRVVESIYSFFNHSTHSEKSTAELSPTEAFFTDAGFQSIPNAPQLSPSSASTSNSHVAVPVSDPSHSTTQQAISANTSTQSLVIGQPAQVHLSSPSCLLLERTSSSGSCIVDCRRGSLEQTKQKDHEEHVETISVETKSEADSTETISVVSEDEGEQDSGLTPIPPVSYFGYETAPSEASQSPHQMRRLSSDSEEGEANVEASQVNTTTQPQLLYFSPQVYSQFYPQLQFAPLMIPPNLLMKQLYPVQSMNPSKKDGTTSSNSIISTIDHKQESPERHQSAGKAPMTLSFKLPKSSFQFHPSHSTAEKGGQSSSRLSLHQRHGQKLESTGPLRTKISSLEETRSKRGKHGIYIYTTPSAPLKFMSLSSGKESASSDGNSRKLVAGAPVPPPGREAVVLKDSSYQLHPVKQSPQQKQTQQQRQVQQEKKSRRESLPVRTGSASGSSPPVGKHSLSPIESATCLTPMPVVSGRRNAIKRKRELVFHWYQSPANSHNIPKRTKMLDSV